MKLTIIILIWAVGSALMFNVTKRIYKSRSYQQDKAIEHGVSLRMRLTIYYTLTTIAILLSWITVVASWIAYLIWFRKENKLTE